jgi:Ca2+/Na+ antiporter
MSYKPKIFKVKFRPMNLFYAFTIGFLYTFLFDLQTDYFSVILLCIFLIIMFPVFEKEKENNKTDL